MRPAGRRVRMSRRSDSGAQEGDAIGGAYRSNNARLHSLTGFGTAAGGLSVTHRGVMPAQPSVAIPPAEDAILDRWSARQQSLAEPGQSGARLVSRGTDAFALRALSARAAARSLDLQYYIWHNDATGRYLAGEALAAADRGVRVRLLLDDMDARQRDVGLMALDQHPRIEIRLFNPFITRSGALRTMAEVFSHGSRLNHRMHNKAWIADGRIALVGGRNIGDEYFSASDGVNFVDLDVLLAGAAVEQAARSFDEYWNSASSIRIGRLRRPAMRSRLTLDEVRRALADAAQAQADSAYLRRLRESPGIVSLLQGDYRLAWQSGVQVVADDPRKAIKHASQIRPGVLDSLIDAFGTTRRELLLISPYFVPGAGGAAGMCQLAAAGIDVEILTNSLAATDVAAVHSGYVRYRKQLLEGGVKLYELKPAPEAFEHEKRMSFGSSRASLHTKAAIVDRERIFVGSFNLDPRSATLNCEMGVWIHSATLAKELALMFEEGATPRRSFVVTLDAWGRTVWTETLDGRTLQYDRDPYAGWSRRAVAWLLKFLPIESQL